MHPFTSSKIKLNRRPECSVNVAMGKFLGDCLSQLIEKELSVNSFTCIFPVLMQGALYFSICFMGHGGSLVDLTPVVQRVAGSNLALAATWGPWASPSLTVACGTSM